MTYITDNLHIPLKKYFGFDVFKKGQEEVIINLLESKDSFILMPTGSGKSLCYQLPAIIKEGTAVVISPLISLMKNQVDLIRGFSQTDNIAHFFNSTLKKSEAKKVYEDVIEKKTKILYVAPESLVKESNIAFLKTIKISFYAVDEAHCISEWGHDFRKEYRRIREIVNQIQIAPIMALTATATPKVQDDIIRNLGIQSAAIFKSSFNRPNLYYEVRPKKNALKQIIKFIKSNSGKSGIIYCLSRKSADKLAESLQVNDIQALPYHAGLDANTRSLHQDKFLKEDVDVIVATIAFGMGIDKPDIRYVIHYNMPKSLEGYYQETGRAGRDGREGKCISFYSYKDIEKLEKFTEGKPVAEKEIRHQLLFEVMTYAESSICRRTTLLHYFGEKYDKENCENCDNCLHKKKEFEGKKYLTKALKSVLAVEELFKPDHIVGILTGSKLSAIKPHKHDKLSIYNTEKDSHFWNMVFRRAIIHDYLKKDIENYGVVKLTTKGHEFLKNPHSFMLTEDHKYDEEECVSISEVGSTAAADEELYGILKQLRKTIAKKNNVPPYVIFQDASLEDMANQYPITTDELATIQGVGVGKAKRYGKLFLDIIKKHVDINEIIRPKDFVVKSVVKKSKYKVNIIQSIDRKIDLEEVAKGLRLTFPELIKEMEAIVFSGTKLDINYFINTILDNEIQDDIYDYFQMTDKGSILQACKDMDDEYTEDEVRLMRIKFYSEMGI